MVSRHVILSGFLFVCLFFNKKPVFLHDLESQNIKTDQEIFYWLSYVTSVAFFSCAFIWRFWIEKFSLALFSSVTQKGENQEVWNVLMHNRHRCRNLHCCEGGYQRPTETAGESPVDLGHFLVSHMIYVRRPSVGENVVLSFPSHLVLWQVFKI